MSSLHELKCNANHTPAMEVEGAKIYGALSVSK